MLDAGCYIGIMLVDSAHLRVVCGWLAEVFWVTARFRKERRVRWPRISEKIGESCVEHAVSRMMKTKIVHIQCEGSIAVLVDKFPNFVGIARGPIRRHAHHFVLPLVHFEPQECGEGAVQQA